MTRHWMERGTHLLLRAVGNLTDDDFAAPTRLPGWTRAHVVAHVALNAAALRRLVRWARTGEPTPMYGSARHRAEEIEEGATRSPAHLRTLVEENAELLSADLAALTPGQWRAEVVTAQGRTVPATEIPWMRTREVAVHAVDLEAGVAFADLPEDLCEELVSDVVARRSSLWGDPALTLTSTTGRTWTLTGESTPVSVYGEPAELARWLTGRGGAEALTGSGVRPPTLTPWL